MHNFDAIPGLRLGLRAALSLPALLVLTSCASLVQEPRVALAEIGLASVGITGATARVELDVFNPNRFSLNARSVEYTLHFHPGDPSETAEIRDGDWRTLATGRSAEAISLAGGENTPVTVLIPFEYAELGAAASSLLRDGSLRYRFSGAFTVGSPVGDLRIPFDRTGILNP
jgi:hypothetical protein